MSYIIANNQIVAKINAEVASGAQVQFSRVRTEDQINAARVWNLVNAQTGKISNAAKWDAVWSKTEDSRYATEINPGEYFVA